MEDKHIPMVLLSNTVILGVQFQHMNFGRTKTQVYLHSIPCSPLQKYPTLVTCTHPHLQSYACGIQTQSYMHTQTHTLPSPTSTQTHTLSAAHMQTPSPAPSHRSHLLSSTLCLSHTQSQLHSPNFPLPTPADIHTKVKASSSGLLNHRNASSNNCFLIHNCHFFLKNLYCSVVDYNVVLVPGVRQSEPVICIHTGTPLQILCQYRLLQSTE